MSPSACPPIRCRCQPLSSVGPAPGMSVRCPLCAADSHSSPGRRGWGRGRLSPAAVSACPPPRVRLSAASPPAMDRLCVRAELSVYGVTLPAGGARGGHWRCWLQEQAVVVVVKTSGAKINPKFQLHFRNSFRNLSSPGIYRYRCLDDKVLENRGKLGARIWNSPSSRICVFWDEAQQMIEIGLEWD